MRKHSCYRPAMRYLLILGLIACAVGAQALPRQAAQIASRQAAQSDAAAGASAGAKSAKSAAAPKPYVRKVPCKTPENASMCYWAHAEIRIASGDPSFRLWKIGTKRILAIYSGPSHFPPKTDEDSEQPEFPASVDNAWDAAYKLKIKTKNPDQALPDPMFGDFEVCPLEPEHRGWMQSVCLESAKNLVVEIFVGSGQPERIVRVSQ